MLMSYSWLCFLISYVLTPLIAGFPDGWTSAHWVSVASVLEHCTCRHLEKGSRVTTLVSLAIVAHFLVTTKAVGGVLESTRTVRSSLSADLVKLESDKMFVTVSTAAQQGTNQC